MFGVNFEELGGKGASAVLGLLFGAAVTWVLARWKRHRERQSVLRGDARDTIVIAHHVVESAAGRPTALHVRTLGQGELDRVVPNGHLAAVLLGRAFQVTPRSPLVSMDGAEGSYLLETLSNFVGDRVGNAPFDHDLYVMAPCCEPAGLAEHQPITLILIAAADLTLFGDWSACRDIRVERGNDGTRVLTLMELARRHAAEQAELTRRRQAGQRTLYAETMYILDLALDKRTAAAPTKPVPWERFAARMKDLGLA